MLNVLAGIVSHLQLRENEWTAEAVGGYAALSTYLLIVNMHSFTHLLEFFSSPQNFLEYFWGFGLSDDEVGHLFPQWTGNEGWHSLCVRCSCLSISDCHGMMNSRQERVTSGSTAHAQRRPP